jgi:hypothetical protein
MSNGFIIFFFSKSTYSTVLTYVKYKVLLTTLGAKNCNQERLCGLSCLHPQAGVQ